MARPSGPRLRSLLRSRLTSTSSRALPGRADTPILAMTANAFEEERALCLGAGMNDFVIKPVDVNALYACMLKWLAMARP